MEGPFEFEVTKLMDVMRGAYGRSRVGEMPDDGELHEIALDMLARGVRVLPVRYGDTVYGVQQCGRTMWRHDRPEQGKTYARVMPRVFTADSARVICEGWGVVYFATREEAAAAASEKDKERKT